MNPRLTKKQIENDRYISILTYISSQAKVLVLSSARAIILFRRVIDSSTPILPKVMAGQMFKVDPVSTFGIITLYN